MKKTIPEEMQECANEMSKDLNKVIEILKELEKSLKSSHLDMLGSAIIKGLSLQRCLKEYEFYLEFTTTEFEKKGLIRKVK